MRTSRPPSMNALAKRISHPKWTGVPPILDIIEKAVRHPLWHTTRIDDNATSIIVDRIVDLPPVQDAKQLDRINELLAKLVQKRSFAAIGFPAMGGIGMIVAREFERKPQDYPWTSAVIENTSNGMAVLSFTNPAEFEAWLDHGRLSDKTAYMGAVRYIRNIGMLQKIIQQNTTGDAEKEKLYRKVKTSLYVLDKIAGRVEDNPVLWVRLAQKIGVGSVSDFESMEKEYNGSYPRIRTGLRRAFLTTRASDPSQGKTTVSHRPRI